MSIKYLNNLYSVMALGDPHALKDLARCLSTHMAWVVSGPALRAQRNSELRFRYWTTSLYFRTWASTHSTGTCATHDRRETDRGMRALLCAWLAFLCVHSIHVHAADTTTCVISSCPSSPNCALASAQPGSTLAPFRLKQEPALAWPAVVQAVSAMPRTELVVQTDDYLRAEVRSAAFGFIDDLEVHLDAQEGVLELRSAARSGYWDLGVNRRRLLDLHDVLVRRSVISDKFDD